ncbi:hypothetical protein EVAR_58138_1 [Eumeta japonica]|uniref:Endonuclease/exonuclease/phosphatase domain-containing protein n=1 Tax=Eumeta variegata TaxID=151549 RepID=A0A4C1YXC3_EUMVA|nr:hypothetical protein EVAR_58138_1 [Eumeta japonica]
MQTVQEQKIDLVLISEPYKHLNGQPWETDSTTKSVIWSCGKLSFQGVVNNGNAGFIAASVDGIRFYSCYAPPSLTIVDFIDLLDRLTDDAKQYYPVAIAGDFNAWVVDWGSKLTNARGKEVLEAFSTLYVVLLNSGDTPTYTKGDASSIVDITFVSSSLIRRNCDWRVMDLYKSSNHNAILWEVSIDQNPRRPVKKFDVTGWKVKSSDPSTFVAALNDEPITTGSAEEKIKNRMKRVAQTCMPRKRDMNQRPPVHWWNDHISALVERPHQLTAERVSQEKKNIPAGLSVAQLGGASRRV